MDNIADNCLNFSVFFLSQPRYIFKVSKIQCNVSSDIKCTLPLVYVVKNVLFVAILTIIFQHNFDVSGSR